MNVYASVDINIAIELLYLLCLILDNSNPVKSKPNRKARIKISEVCSQFIGKYINTIEMFRKLNETFQSITYRIGNLI
jgi:hypothetical protein